MLKGLRIREQDLLESLRPPRSSGRVSRQLHRLQPSVLAQRLQCKQPLLRPASPVRRLVEPRPPDGSQLACCHIDLDLVAGKRLPSVLDGETLGRASQGSLSPRDRLLAVDAPVPKARVAQSVQHPHEAPQRRRRASAPPRGGAPPEAKPRTTAGERLPSSHL